MEVEIRNKKYEIKEILYKDIVKLGTTDKVEAAKKLLQLSAGLTDEEYDSLTMKDGLVLQKAVNEVNGLGEDFQNALAK